MHAEIDTDPGCKIRCWASAFDDVRSSLPRVLSQHQFTFSVEVVAPPSLSLSSVVALLQSEQRCFWRGLERPLSLLRSAHFEGVSLLCEGLDARRDDAVQLRSDGALIVQHCDATHRLLGLDSTRCSHSMWRAQLLRSSPPSSRVDEALRRLPLFQCVALRNDGAEIALPAPGWKQVRQELSSRRHKITLPTTTFRPEFAREEMMTLFEWTGAVLIGTSWPIAAAPEGPEVEVGVASLSGMIPTASIMRLIEKLRVGLTTFCAVVVRGFEDDLETDGENNIVIILLPGGRDYFGFISARKFPL